MPHFSANRRVASGTRARDGASAMIPAMPAPRARRSTTSAEMSSTANCSRLNTMSAPAGSSATWRRDVPATTIEIRLSRLAGLPMTSAAAMADSIRRSRRVTTPFIRPA